MKTRGLLTVATRGLSAVAKFALFLYLARNFEAGVIGSFGLITATCALVVQFLGLEFHYFNTRALLAVEHNERGRLIRDQFVLHFICYLIVVPWFTLLFTTGFMDWKYAIYLFPLIIMEHLSQEMFRVLVTCFKPIFATFVQFVRGGLWVIGFIAFAEIAGREGSLEGLLGTWLTFSAASVVLGAIGCGSVVTSQSIATRIDWVWISRGMKISMPFVVTTVCFTGLQYFDRFFLNHFMGEAEVGIFFFFSSLASFFYLVITFAVGIYAGPKILYAYQTLGQSAFRKERSEAIKKNIRVGLVILFPAVFSIYLVLAWVGKPEYYANVHVYWIMLGANIVLLVADGINFELYVRGRDMAIMWSAVAAMILSAVFQTLMIPNFGIEGAAMATMATYASLGLLRYGFLQYRKPLNKPVIEAGS